MRLLSRSFVVALCLLAVAGLAAVLSFNVAAAALAWPGLMIVNAIGSHFGIYLHDAPLWQWLVPGLLIDVALYTVLFFALALLWRNLFPKSETEPSMKKPATNAKRPTTVS